MNRMEKKLVSYLDEVLEKAMSDLFNQDSDTSESTMAAPQYTTPEEYKNATGKRFRVTKDQKKRIEEGSLTREEAFQEFLSKQSES